VNIVIKFCREDEGAVSNLGFLQFIAVPSSSTVLNDGSGGPKRPDPKKNIPLQRK